MASASSWKLKALLKKNLLIMKRNICSTICEILFPIILILLLYLLKTVFDINNYYFEIEEIDTSTYAHKRSVFNVDPLPNTQQFKFNISEYGMSILPALNICSIFNKNNKPRNYIGVVCLPDEIKERLINESLYFKGLNYFGLSWNSFINFTNEEQMNNYIKSSSYGEEEDHPLLCFGLC